MLELALHTEASKVKAKAIAQQLGAIPFSDEVTDILRKEDKQNKHVRVLGLAVDFYLSLYLRDVVAKRADGADGFDPVTKTPCFIFREGALTNYNMILTRTINERLSWIESFLFTYLCAACAGELRHTSHRVSSLSTYDKDRLGQFKINWNGSGGNSRTETQRQFLQTTTKTRVPEFLTMATEVFKGYNWGGSYGGPKWGDISKTGSDRLGNSLDRIAFIDRVFDLKHNGGPIFDKNGAVHNDYLQDFLNSKLKIKTDVEWESWLQYVAPSLIECLKMATKTSLWNSKKDLTNIKLTPSLYNPNNHEDTVTPKPSKQSSYEIKVNLFTEVSIPKPTKPKPAPTPAKQLDYPVATAAELACPTGEHK